MVSYKEVQTIGEFIDYIRLRTAVFVIEQGFKPGWEPDEYDKVCRHFIAVADGRVVGTLRIREKDGIKIERMATAKDYRGKGIAKGLVDFVIKEAKKTNPKRIWAQCQTRAHPFWNKSGFRDVSESYDQYGVEHVDKELDS